MAVTVPIPQVVTVTVLLLILRTSAAGTASDTLSNGGNLADGETLVSSGSTFTLGFFSLAGVPTKRYLGIWFTADADAVCWVANRDSPLNTTNGSLMISSAGSLRLLDGSGQTAWSSNTTGGASGPVVTRLLESGNLVVHEEQSSGGDVLWQSFDHPSNTLLSGMKIGKNLQTGMEWLLTSWRAPNDPSPGKYRRVLDTKGLPDSVLWNGNVKKYRTGPWNGLRFSGVPETASYSSLVSIQVIFASNETNPIVRVLQTAACPSALEN